MSNDEVAERDAEIAQLRAWKAEASQVMSGLQEVGRALGVPLGQQITARATVDAALDLRNERDDLRTKEAALRGAAGGVLAYCSDQLSDHWTGRLRAALSEPQREAAE